MSEPESSTASEEATARTSGEEQIATPASAPPRRASEPRRSAGEGRAEGGPLGAYEALARSPRLEDLVAVTRKIVGEAAEARRVDFGQVAKIAEAAEEAKLARADADTPFGNALKVLEAGPEGDAERALASALVAHAVAESSRDDDDKVASDVLWLATYTPFDATPLVDRALGEEADDLWAAIADRVRRIAQGRGGSRAEALVGCAALAASESPAAAKHRGELAAALSDRILLRLLRPAECAAGDVRLEGQIVPSPRGPVATALLALTGLLFVEHAARLTMRLALAYRCPAEVTMNAVGVRIKTRTEMLGKVLREREHVIARSGLVRVVREVRYPRAAFYAGLLALAVGSYVGVRAFVDGVRAASPSLVLIGLVIVALGIGADFVLGSVLPGARGRCRISFVPRVGRILSVAGVDARRADDALARSLAPRAT